MLKAQLPGELEAQYESALDDWKRNGKVQRLWQRDASLWTGADEAKWMGWLDVVAEQQRDLQQLLDLQRQVRDRGYKHCVLLGMGGSSLSPEVTSFTFGKQEGYPQLLILDSTDPAQIRTLEGKFAYDSTLFVVASKSGSTLEPNIFKRYFFERAKQELGLDKAAEHFIAITDPGSKMQHVAEGDRFWKVFFGLPSIGGRYSALSNFGMVPAAIAGVDVEKLLASAQTMHERCRLDADQNPGVMLGCALGALGNAGHDKVTIVATDSIFDLGAWLEQLIAESTGKIGKGLIPVDREALASPGKYGSDRVFAYIRLKSDRGMGDMVDALANAGQPVLTIDIDDPYDIAGEYFRWEIATAVAGSILGINPFDQPDVEASKIATKALTSEYEQKGSLPQEQPFFEGAGIKLYADQRNANDLLKSSKDKSLAGYVRAHLERLRANDYFAISAYIEMNEEHEDELQFLRHCVRDTKKNATCLGFGPRFLHSTGQAYKGGPNSGVFLQVTCDHDHDLPVPGQRYTFGIVEAAQARGDFQVLADRQRRALRVHLSADVSAGLQHLSSAVQSALNP